MKLRNKVICLFIFGLIVVSLIFFMARLSVVNEGHAKQNPQEEIQSVIDARLHAQTSASFGPFQERDASVSILLIGLDSRAGDTVGHCDVIQFIEIDDKAQTVHVTAVPRGTYSPLPGTGHVPSDYYVSNACGIAGLEYGIAQIEKILGKRADHVVFIGFSQAIGAFRLLGLPATETLQWLRVRQPYAIGEPQRAHNHSTFLKYLLTSPKALAVFGWPTALQYVLYNLVETDLTFSQAQALVASLENMQLQDHTDRISLFIKPEYVITDIPYNEDQLDAVLQTKFNPKDGPSKEEIQQQMIDAINAGLVDPLFVKRAFEQHLWLQIDDKATRESVHFSLLTALLSQTQEDQTRESLLADYVIEMEALGESYFAQQGRILLAK